MATRTDSRAELLPDRTHPDDRLVVEVARPRAGAEVTVTVRGDVDVASASVLRQRLESLLGEGVEHLLVDLTDVPFCDVAGLNVLLRVQSQLSRQGGRLTVLGPCRSLEIMMAALGLDLESTPCEV